MVYTQQQLLRASASFFFLPFSITSIWLFPSFLIHQRSRQCVTITRYYLALGASKKNLVVSSLIQAGWTRDSVVRQTFLHKTGKSFLLLTNQLWPFMVDILLLPQHHWQKYLQSREIKSCKQYIFISFFFLKHRSAGEVLTFPNQGRLLLCVCYQHVFCETLCVFVCMLSDNVFHFVRPIYPILQDNICSYEALLHLS